MPSTIVTYAFIVYSILLLGEFIATWSKGKIPQMLIVAICFLIGYWTIFPLDILDQAGVMTMGRLFIAMLIINVGSRFSLESLKTEWKTALITLGSIGGVLLMVIGVGSLLVGQRIAIASAAPVTGGSIAAVIINEAAVNGGEPELGLLANMIFIMQGFVGFPMTSFFLRREGAQQLAAVRQGQVEAQIVQETSREANRRLLEDYIPAQYKTTTFYLVQLLFWGTVSYWVSAKTGIDSAVLQIFLGIVLANTGLLDRDTMSKTEAQGILMPALLGMLMSSFAYATVDVLSVMIARIFIVLALASLGIIVMASLLGKLFNYSANLSIAIGLNCFLGFPFNFAITNEVIKGLAQNQAEEDHLQSYLMPKMIIAGVISVSIVSAVLAGIFANYLFT